MRLRRRVSPQLHGLRKEREASAYVLGRRGLKVTAAVVIVRGLERAIRYRSDDGVDSTQLLF
jgi:hypothetical protein